MGFQFEKMKSSWDRWNRGPHDSVRRQTVVRAPWQCEETDGSEGPMTVWGDRWQWGPHDSVRRQRVVRAPWQCEETDGSEGCMTVWRRDSGDGSLIVGKRQPPVMAPWQNEGSRWYWGLHSQCDWTTCHWTVLFSKVTVVNVCIFNQKNFFK